MREEQICTPEHPYKKGDAGRWSHPQAVEVDEYYGARGGVADGDFIQYHCPVCNHKFWVELPN